MAIISRRQYDHPALATAGGSALHASISNLYTVLGDDSMSRYKTFTAVANSSVGVIAHEFGLDFANLKVQIFTGTYPALTLVSDPIGTGWTVAATSGLASRSIDVTAPASGGPHTYAVLVSHESNATAFIPGLVSIGAQIFAGPKTFTGTLFGTDATDSSSSTTGAFKTAGGMGVAKQLVVGTNTIIGGSTKVNTFLERTLSIQSPTSASLEQAGIEIVGDSASVGDLSSAVLFSDINSAEAHKRYAMIAGYAASAGAITAGGQLAFHTSTTGNTLTEVGRVNEAGAWTFGSADAADISHIIAGAGITSRKPIQWGASALTSGRAASISTVGTATNGDKLIFANNTTVGEAKLLHGDSSTVGFIGLAAGGTGVAAGDIHTSWHSGSASSTYATIGKVTFAGAWTLGAASGSQTHTVNGNNISLVGSNSFYRLGTAGGYLGQADGPGSFFTGTIGGDTLLVGQGNLWLTAGAPSSISSYMRLKITSTPTIDFLSTSNAVLGTVNSSGAWTLGAASGAQTHTLNAAKVTLALPATGGSIDYSANSQSWHIGNIGSSTGSLGGTNSIYFYDNTGSKFVGGISTAGAWTLGPASSVNENLIVNGTVRSQGYSPLGGTHTGNGSMKFGSIDANCGVIQYDTNSSTLFSIDNTYDNASAVTQFRMRTAGTPVVAGKFTGAGAWTLGASGSAAYFPGTRTNTGAAVVGTPNSQSKSLPSNSSTATFDLSTTGFQTTGGGALCFVTEGAANNSVLFFVAGNGATTTITIISQTAAGYYVVGAPGAANKIGITHTNGTTAALLLTAGSSGFAATSVWLTCLTNAAGA